MDTLTLQQHGLEAYVLAVEIEGVPSRRAVGQSGSGPRDSKDVEVGYWISDLSAQQDLSGSGANDSPGAATDSSAQLTFIFPALHSSRLTVALNCAVNS